METYPKKLYFIPYAYNLEDVIWELVQVEGNVYTDPSAYVAHNLEVAKIDDDHYQFVRLVDVTNERKYLLQLYCDTRTIFMPTVTEFKKEIDKRLVEYYHRKISECEQKLFAIDDKETEMLHINFVGFNHCDYGTTLYMIKDNNSSVELTIIGKYTEMNKDGVVETKYFVGKDASGDVYDIVVKHNYEYNVDTLMAIFHDDYDSEFLLLDSQASVDAYFENKKRKGIIDRIANLKGSIYNLNASLKKIENVTD